MCLFTITRVDRAPPKIFHFDDAVLNLRIHFILFLHQLLVCLLLLCFLLLLLSIYLLTPDEDKFHCSLRFVV